MTRKALSFLFILTIAAAVPMADVWDTQTDNDDTSGTDNELVHGTTQAHDLGARPGPVADQDWYLMPQQRQSSYEVLVDGVSGDLGFAGFALQRIAGDGTTVLQTAGSAVPGAFGYARALRFQNTTAATITDQFVKVSGGFCGTSCTSNDVYTIKARETTISVARFNNAGSQVTVLLTQNTTGQTINANYFYYNAAGTLLQNGTLTLAARALNVFNTTSFGTLVGQGGSISITHDGPYGGLNVKTVALEPATGFSFDTPGTTRPY